MPAVNERALVEHCQRGDPSAFRELVEARKDLVFALVARTLGDPARAELLAQEVFLQLHHDLPYFRADRPLAAGLHRAVVTVCAGSTGDAPGARDLAEIATLDDEARADAIARLLGARPSPRAPDGFAARVATRVYLEQWRREQALDTGFNVTMAVAGLAVTAGGVFLASSIGLTAVGGDMVRLLESASLEALGRVASALPVNALLLAIAGLGLWWWMERDFQA